MEGLSKAKDPERQALGIWKLSMEERDKLEDLEAELESCPRKNNEAQRGTLEDRRSCPWKDYARQRTERAMSMQSNDSEIRSSTMGGIIPPMRPFEYTQHGIHFPSLFKTTLFEAAWRSKGVVLHMPPSSRPTGPAVSYPYSCYAHTLFTSLS
uniref:TFIIS central domain-containing protein n=1 Tax=Steinernema glaseri TaxID=37863 RepID=A0A1I8AKE4_9BILA